MRDDTRAKMPKSKTAKLTNARGKTFPPTRREFLRTAAGATLAMMVRPSSDRSTCHRQGSARGSAQELATRRREGFSSRVGEFCGLGFRHFGARIVPHLMRLLG